MPGIEDDRVAEPVDIRMIVEGSTHSCSRYTRMLWTSSADFTVPYR
jgi:hypothetical protein